MRAVLEEAAPVQEKTFIQCHDDAEKGDSSIHLLATENSGQSPALSFVITRTGEATYFGRVAAAALWLNRTAQKRLSQRRLKRYTGSSVANAERSVLPAVAISLLRHHG